MVTCRNCDYDDEYEDDEGSCERCGKLLRSHEIEICTECARDIDKGDDAWDYDDEEDEFIYDD